MVCAWLLFSGFSPSAVDAAFWFARLRTGCKADKEQGVSQPSQQRYVGYIEQVRCAS